MVGSNANDREPAADGDVVDTVLAVLHDAVDAVRDALAAQHDWGPSGRRSGQYASDLTADAAALGVLGAAGVGVLSEESGATPPPGPGPLAGVTVVVDPLDGSTNASRGIPWYAASVCAVDDAGALAAVVADLVRGVRWEAARGRGARRDGAPIAPRTPGRLADAVVGVSGYPSRWLGWRQYRALGAAALDLCAVADGTLDGYVDCSWNAHGPWDYLGGLLVCREAGAVVDDVWGRELVVLGHDDRRTPVAAGSAEVFAEIVAARRASPVPGEPGGPGGQVAPSGAQ